MILDFEKRHYRAQGDKESDIDEVFSLTATRYYQLLAALLDEPTALEAEPVLVYRLRRIRDSRQASRRAS